MGLDYGLPGTHLGLALGGEKCMGIVWGCLALDVSLKRFLLKTRLVAEVLRVEILCEINANNCSNITVTTIMVTT